jgi:hypothetical protein
MNKDEKPRYDLEERLLIENPGPLKIFYRKQSN